MGRAFARPLILPWTWILSNLSSNIYASLLSLDGFGDAHGEGSKRKAFCETMLVTKWAPNGTKNCPGRLYLSRGGNPSTKKGPTKGKAAPLKSIRWVLERCLVEIVADWGHKIGARRVAKWSLFGGVGKCENSAPV